MANRIIEDLGQGRTRTRNTNAPAVDVASDGIEQQASWSKTGTRFFILDNENGNDENVGYVDVATAPSATVLSVSQTRPAAIKTLERLSEIVPPRGNGRSYVVLCKVRSDAGAYVAKDRQTVDSIVLNTTGYQSEIIHASSDLSFSDADKKSCGAWKDPALAGPNADGSWTVDTITNVGSGDGATVAVVAGQALPADVALIRANYLAAEDGTNTGPNQLGKIVKRLSDTTFRVRNGDLKIAAGGKFWLARPGIAVSAVLIAGQAEVDADDSVNRSMVEPARHVAGFRVTVPETNHRGVVCGWDFMNFEGDYGCSGGFRFSGLSVRDSAGTLIGPSTGCVYQGRLILSMGIQGYERLPVVQGQCQIINPGPAFQFGEDGGRIAGFFPSFYGGYASGSFTTGDGQFGFRIGSGDSDLYLIFEDGVFAVGLSARIDGVVLNGNTDTLGFTDDGLTIAGPGCTIAMDRTKGTPVGAGIAFTGTGTNGGQARGCALTLYSSPALVPGGSEVAMVDGQVATYAALATSERVDNHGNRVMGAAVENTKKTSGTIGNFPVLGADPGAPADGDVWLKDTGGVRTLHARIGGVTYSTTLT